MERGTIPPPQSKEILQRYAEALEIKQGSDEWFSLVDLAAADRGIIPNDIMEDEELVKELPAFFRTLRGKSLLNKTCRMSSAKSRKVTDAEQSGAFQNSIYFKRRLLEVPTK